MTQDKSDGLEEAARKFASDQHPECAGKHLEYCDVYQEVLSALRKYGDKCYKEGYEVGTTKSMVLFSEREKIKKVTWNEAIRAVEDTLFIIMLKKDFKVKEIEEMFRKLKKG